MPLYEYRCDKCGFTTEELQQIGSETPQCPQCGGVMQRVFSPIAMVKWKGEGGFPSLRKAHLGTSPYTSHYGEYEGGESIA